MHGKQVFLIFAAILLTAGLLKFGKTETPLEEAMAQMEPAETEENEASIDFAAWIQEFKSSLSAEQLDTIQQMEKAVEAASSKNQKLASIEQLAKTWDKYRSLELSTYYFGLLSEESGNYRDLLDAGSRCQLATQIIADSSQKAYFGQQAVKLLQNAIELEPDSVKAKLSLAALYVDGRQEIMKGVFLLREVVEQEPDNVFANLSLGRLSVRSGQWDKAIGRLENVLKADPKNTEALYYLGETYMGKGNKSKAAEYFEQCKSLIDNPKFNEQLDRYLKTIQ